MKKLALVGLLALTLLLCGCQAVPEFASHYLRTANSFSIEITLAIDTPIEKVSLFPASGGYAWKKSIPVTFTQSHTNCITVCDYGNASIEQNAFSFLAFVYPQDQDAEVVTLPYRYSWAAQHDGHYGFLLSETPETGFQLLSADENAFYTVKDLTKAPLALQ